MADFKVREVVPERTIPNPEDLIFILHARISDVSQEEGTSLEGQVKRMKASLSKLGATFYPQFVISGKQHSTEGYHREDFEDIKRFHEQGIDSDKANAVMCYNWHRAGGRDIEGAIKVFGTSYENYLRDEWMELYELDHRINLHKADEKTLLGIRTSIYASQAQSILIESSKGMHDTLEKRGFINRPPMLWVYNKKANEVSLIKENVKVLHEVVRLYKTKKIGMKDVASNMTKRGFRIVSNKNREGIKSNVTEFAVQQLITRKVFHTGIWDDRKDFTNKETGRVINTKPELPFIYNGKPVSTLEDYEELQAIVRERRCRNGKHKYDWLLNGIVRRKDNQKRMSGTTAINRWTTRNGEKRVYRNLYYAERKFYVPKELLEESVLREHENMLLDSNRFKKALGDDPKKKAEDKRELKSKNKELGIVQKQMNVIEHTLKTKKLRTKLIENMSDEHGNLDAIATGLTGEIERLKERMNSSSYIVEHPRINTIREELLKAGIDGMGYEKKREFLLGLYPFRSKEYAIFVWKDGDKFHWESRGKLSNTTLKGMFHTKPREDMPVITCKLKAIIGREPTEKEAKILKKNNLLDKVVWTKKDVLQLQKLIDFCVADMGNYAQTGTENG